MLGHKAEARPTNYRSTLPHSTEQQHRCLYVSAAQLPTHARCRPDRPQYLERARGSPVETTRRALTNVMRCVPIALVTSIRAASPGSWGSDLHANGAARNTARTARPPAPGRRTIAKIKSCAAWTSTSSLPMTKSASPLPAVPRAPNGGSSSFQPFIRMRTNGVSWSAGARRRGSLNGSHAVFFLQKRSCPVSTHFWPIDDAAAPGAAVPLWRKKPPVCSRPRTGRLGSRWNPPDAVIRSSAKALDRLIAGGRVRRASKLSSMYSHAS